jgi:hypothetical protein
MQNGLLTSPESDNYLARGEQLASVFGLFHHTEHAVGNGDIKVS